MFDSDELLSVKLGPKSISTALNGRTQWVTIRRNLKHDWEAPKVNISPGSYS